MLTNQIIQLIWYVFFTLLVTGVIGWIFFTIYRDKRRERLILNFADYTAVLSFYMEKAYDIIHKDKILIYSLEATKLPDKEFNVYSREFIRLVFKLLGPILTSQFLKFFGDYDTFTFYLAEYFNSRYEGDEIRKASMENLMQSDIEAPEELKGEPNISNLSGKTTGG
jgi:hypothetical protein